MTTTDNEPATDRALRAFVVWAELVIPLLQEAVHIEAAAYGYDRINQARNALAAERAIGAEVLDVERLQRALAAHPDRLTWSTVIRLYPDWLATEYARLTRERSGQ